MPAVPVEPCEVTVNVEHRAEPIGVVPVIDNFVGVKVTVVDVVNGAIFNVLSSGAVDEIVPVA